jgi:hypothetical protein
MMVRYLGATDKPIVGLEILGKIPGAEYDEVDRRLKAMYDQYGCVHMLFHMIEPSVLQPAPFWKDVELSLDHLADVERLAIIGDQRWLEAYTLVLAPQFPAITVRHFTLPAKDEAWAWLQS